jgi:transposase
VRQTQGGRAAKRQRKQSDTPESPAKARRSSLNTRSSTSAGQPDRTTLSLKSEALSISRKPASRGFWNRSYAEASGRLSLPIEIGSAGSATASSNGSADAAGARSGFWPTKETLDTRRQSRNSRKTYSQPRLSSLPGYTDEGATRNARQKAIENAAKSGRPIKVTVAEFKLHVEEKLRNVYENMARAYRWAYNEAVAVYKKLGIRSPCQWTTEQGRGVRTSVLSIAKEKKWTAKFPRKLLQQGAEEFVKAAKSAWGLYKSKKRTGREPKLPVFRPRTRKEWSDRWRFTVPATCCHFKEGQIVMFPQHLARHWKITEGSKPKVRPRQRQAFHELFDVNRHPFSEVAICKLVSGEIVFRTTRYEREEVAPLLGGENQAAEQGERPRLAIGLDPGKRTFLTGYINEVGCGDVDVELNRRLLSLRRRLLRIDQILAGRGSHRGPDKMPTGALRRRVVLRRRAIEGRIANIVDDAHWKIAHWLCRTADDIVLGKFHIPSIIRGGIAASTKWVLLRQRHCLFRQRLLHVCGQYSGVEMHLQNEAYTSKTCTNCGLLNEGLGASKVFECPHCGKKFDRDGNAARNIMLRWLVEKDA